MIQRRSFLTGLAGVLAMPAIARAGVLMPVKRLDLRPVLDAGKIQAHMDAICRHGWRTLTMDEALAAMNYGTGWLNVTDVLTDAKLYEAHWPMGD